MSSLIPPVLRDKVAIQTVLTSGLDYGCAASSYLRAEWLRDYWHLSGGPNEYLRRWYVPLLERGYQIPFFFVLDLGLLFVDGLRFPRYTDMPLAAEGQQLRTRYLRFLGQLREQPVTHQILDTIERDGRRRRLVNRQHDPLRWRLAAAPTFVELCLSAWETPQEVGVIIDPQAVSDLDNARWHQVTDRLEHPPTASKESAAWHTWGLSEDPNRSFLRALLSQIADPSAKLSIADEQAVRTQCLGTTHYADLDLLLLGNYTQHHTLNAETFAQHELGPLQRALSAVAIPTHSAERLGGYHGISYDGAWSSLVHSQLALFDQHESLFLHKYYDHKVLYYERRSPRTRPLSLLLAVLVDTTPALRRKLPGEGFYNALTREVAAYLVEDVVRYLGQLQLNLDVYLACFPASDGQSGVFFNAGEAVQSWPDTKPLLTQRMDTLVDYFRLDPPRAVTHPPIDSRDESDRTAALRCFQQRLTTELAERTRCGEGVTSYDCLQLAVVTVEQPVPDQPAALEFSVGLATRSGRLHWLALDAEGFTWSSVRAPSRLLESHTRETYPQLRVAQATRQQFLKIVIQDAVRSSALI